MHKQAIVFLLIISPIWTFAQLDNTAFDNRMSVNEVDSSTLFFGVNFLGFLKNNEFFNTTIEGYTLFGYQINPYVSYNISPRVRLDAGVFAQKDFGNSEYSEVLPTLSLKYKHNNFAFIFGTLEGSTNHRLIEPLYDFERLLKSRIENGLQFLWQGEKTFADVWVDWQQMIYPGDTLQEAISGGVSFSRDIISASNFRLAVPLQLTVYHRGGQIDTSDEPLLTLLNGAVGLEAEKSVRNFIDRWGVKSHYVFSSASAGVLPFDNGSGIFINPYIKTRQGFTLMASYWQSDSFITQQGGLLYPAVTPLYPERVDEKRDWFMLRVFYDKELADGLNLSVRAEPFYDSYDNSLEYSYGFYLHFNDRFFLLKNKKH